MNIKELKIGDELECVDRDSFTRERISTKDAIDFVLTVDVIDHNSVYVRSQLNVNHVAHFHIYLDELRFFKKKEQSQYTFDDLIDVVGQSFKDNKIFSYGVTIAGVSIRFFDESETVFTRKDVKSSIDFIQSLYKETFVIECESDVLRINCDAKTTLQNGYVIMGNGFEVFNTSNCSELFNIIKGATVEQGK